MTPREARAAIERMRRDTADRADAAMADYIHAFADRRFGEVDALSRTADQWVAKRETLDLVCALLGQMDADHHPLSDRTAHRYDRQMRRDDDRAPGEWVEEFGK